MNPAGPVQPVNVVRVPSHPGERRRKDQDASEAFRRALQQHEEEAQKEQAQKEQARKDGGPNEGRPTKPAPAAPAPRALQPRPRDSRRDGGSPAHHVDVLA